MLRRVTSNSEAELSPDGQVRRDGLRENEGKLVSGETAAKDSQDNDKKERFYEYLVMAGRRGGMENKTALCDTAAKKEGKRLLKNLRGRERRRELKKLQVPKNSSSSTKEARRDAQIRTGELEGEAREEMRGEEVESETEQTALINRYCPTTEWPNPSNFFPIYDDWADEMEDGDDLECGIGMPTEDNEGYEVGKTNTLSELFGVENKRVPEDDNFDLGLGLESPDIQRWADETGWSEITSKIEELDYGWDEVSMYPALEPESQRLGRSRRPPKSKEPLRSIHKVGRGFDLELHDVDVLKSRWPISLH
jgi:hypothetical protein